MTDPQARQVGLARALEEFEELLAKWGANEQPLDLDEHDRPGRLHQGRAVTADDDPDPVDRSRACDLGDAGLPGHGLCVAIGADGEEYLLLAAYNLGEADGRVFDWHQIAPHELLGPVHFNP